MSQEGVSIVDAYLRLQENKTLFVPLTDPLMILHAAADYIIKRLELAPMFYVTVEDAAPTMLSVGGAAVHSITIFGSLNTPLYVLKAPPRLGEEAFKLYRTIAGPLVKWAERNEFDRVVVMDVKPCKTESPDVYFAAEERLVGEIAKMGFKPFTGVFTSEAAYFLDECMRSRVDGIMLVVESVALNKLLSLMETLQPSSGKIEEREALALAEDVMKHDEKALTNALRALSKLAGVEIPLDRIPETMKELREALQVSLGDILGALSGRGPWFPPFIA